MIYYVSNVFTCSNRASTTLQNICTITMITELISLNHLYIYITLYFIYIVCILCILLPMYSTETHALYNIWLLLPTFTNNTNNQHCKANPQLQTSQKERRLLLSFIGLKQFRAVIGLFIS